MMLERGEIQAIRLFRDRLQKLERRLEALDDDGNDYGRGRLVEACRATDAALLSLLVVAEVHLGVDGALSTLPQ